jgi:hypothetical protein
MLTNDGILSFNNFSDGNFNSETSAVKIEY